MKPGGWFSIVCIYLFGICGGSTVSKMVPLAGDIADRFGLPLANFGWLVALVALPAAIFAIPSGIVVDRLGSKAVLLAASALAVAANGLYLVADSLPLLYAARLAEGLAIVHIYTAGPALIMATTEGAKRTRSMTLWSTYAPVGTAIGLALGGLFAESAGWRGTFVGHGALFVLAIVIGALLPSVKKTEAAGRGLGDRVAELFSAFARPQLVLLGGAFLLMISMGIGANVTLPLYVARVHGLAAGAASGMVASATLVMVLGSAFAGYVLPKGVRPPLLFAGLAVLALAAGVLCFYPDLALQVRYAAMFGWFFLTGATLATILATLPLVADPRRIGAAAALINFAGAVAALLNPPLWMGVLVSGDWLPFAELLAIGWVLAVLTVGLAVSLANKARASQEGAANG